MNTLMKTVEDLMKLTEEELRELLCESTYNKSNLRELVRRTLKKTEEYKKAFEYERTLNTDLLHLKEFIAIEKLEDFSYFFKKRLWTKELMHALPGCGWNDGGCRSLMKALTIWLDSPYDVETHQIVKDESDIHSQHTLVCINGWYLDGDGVSTYEDLKHRWEIEEGLRSVIIRPFSPEDEPANRNEDEPFYLEDEEIKDIVKKLDAAFDKEHVLELFND